MQNRHKDVDRMYFCCECELRIMASAFLDWWAIQVFEKKVINGISLVITNVILQMIVLYVGMEESMSP